MSKDGVKIRVAVDAAGREPGLSTVVEGVHNALDDTGSALAGVRPVFYGAASDIARELERCGVDRSRVDIVDASDVIEMDDRPRDVLLAKQSSSIVLAAKDLKAGNVQAFISMGNTGAVVGACRAFLGMIRWINKPALGTPFPRAKGMGFMLDAGAVADPKPGHLVQFAAMGSAFVERVYSVVNPRVALLNIGVEAHKGDERTRDAYRLLARSDLHFIGNIEGGDLFKDRADVIVTSGFVGNIILKFTETIPELLQERLQGSGLSIADAGLLADLDYRRYGGATLLGVDGTVVIGHGRSSATAVGQALRWASKMVRGKVVEAMRDRVFRSRRSLWLSNPFARGEEVDDG
ncbi:MAG: phosphate acyltransferase [bacterium]